MRRFILFFSLLALAVSCGPGPVQLRLATYNLHHCEPPQGGDRNYEDIAAVVRLAGPDVIALQELDSCNARSVEFQARVLADLCGMEYLYHRTIPVGGGSYGVGMLYQPSLGLVRTDFLPLPGEEPRGALVAEFSKFVYVSTHFCYQSAEHRANSMSILESWLAERYNDTQKPVFLAGDLNSTSILEGAHSWVPCSTDESTFNGEGRIDYILRMRSRAGDGVTLIHSMPLADAGNLSDHLPVVSFVRIR